MLLYLSIGTFMKSRVQVTIKRLLSTRKEALIFTSVGTSFFTENIPLTLQSFRPYISGKYSRGKELLCLVVQEKILLA